MNTPNEQNDTDTTNTDILCQVTGPSGTVYHIILLPSVVGGPRSTEESE